MYKEQESSQSISNSVKSNEIRQLITFRLNFYWLISELFILFVLRETWQYFRITEIGSNLKLFGSVIGILSVTLKRRCCQNIQRKPVFDIIWFKKSCIQNGSRKLTNYCVNFSCKATMLCSLFPQIYKSQESECARTATFKIV